MTWQEELKKLDDDFAAGKISADDYKVRREQVLSSAVAPGVHQHGDAQHGAEQQENQTPDDANQRGAEATQFVNRVPHGNQTAQHGATMQQPEQGDAADATRIVSPVSSGSEPTQAVPNWQAPQQGPPSPPAGFGQPTIAHQPQQRGWNTADSDSSPPWGGSELPPVPPSSDADWVKQGPEPGGSAGNSAGKIVAAVVIVVVLAGLGLGSFLLWGGDDGDPTAPTADENAENGPAPAEHEHLAMPDLPGSAEDHPGIESVADLPDLNYLISREIDVYEEFSGGEASFLVQRLPSGSRAIVLLVEATDAEAAETAAEELRDIQLDNNAEEANDPPPGVNITEFADNNHEQIRAHYASEDVIVRLEIHNTSEPSVAESDFEVAINAQLDAMPADA
ncbi:hypothetical protein [Haloechinothrix sp. LS1_15]|uniref:hypothetical protein n=1 Tax=Haloechinothrix sp. LS1_15 TaxID=2652248 RepID=UPI0029472C81|nr:hypothetical protein [Haloechinothrix sp. LS1_15]MDV6014549.1 hypothetical protein [Haloechinothrix sp. LS1_15]